MGVQYGKQLQAYIDSQIEKERDEYTKGIYIHGLTGLGKSTNLILGRHAGGPPAPGAAGDGQPAG